MEYVFGLQNLLAFEQGQQEMLAGSIDVYLVWTPPISKAKDVLMRSRQVPLRTSKPSNTVQLEPTSAAQQLFVKKNCLSR